MEQYTSYLESLSYLVTLLGIPVAIFVYVKENNKERREREYGTYNALDDKYSDFLKLCLEHSELNIYPQNPKIKIELTPEQESKRLLIFELLISILERAFLMYRDQGSDIKKEQWEGWSEFMNDWMSRKDFSDAWQVLGQQWDTDFVLHMNGIRSQD